MTIHRLADAAPDVDAAAFVASTASVIGRVALGADASVWFGAVLRGDTEALTIGARSNVQENAVLHADPGYPLVVEGGVTVGHQAMLHGCTVGEGSLIGIQAVVLNGAVIGKHCLVGAGAIVTEKKVFPDRSLILGAPAKVVRELSDADVANLERSAREYVDKAKRFARELTPID